MAHPDITLAEADALIEEGLAAFTSARRPRVPDVALVLDSGPLDPARLLAARDHVESGASLGVQSSPLVKIRHTHHRLAQYLAMGMDETKAAKLCNYVPSRVSILKSDPAFAELLSYYTADVKEEFADFVTSAADLSMDMLGRLREIMEEQPEKLSVQQVMEAIKLLADRSGNAPTTKTMNFNVNADVGNRLDAARRRLRDQGALDAPS